MSVDLLMVMAEEENYTRFSRFVNPEFLPQEEGIIFQDMGKYYHQTGEKTIDWENFEEWFKLVRHPSWKLEKLKPYSHIFKRLETHSSTSLAESIVEEYVTRSYFQAIADVSLKGAEGGGGDMAEIETLIKSWNDETGRVSRLDSLVVSDDIDELIEDVVSSGYEWRLEILNKSVGCIRRGKLICLAARPNCGKSTFLCSEVTHIASQLAEDECVLWFNNEEAGEEVKLRLIQAALQCTFEDINSNRKGAVEKYKKAINGPMSKIKIVDKADVNIYDVEEFLKTHNVKLIVFDQLWKVNGFEKKSGSSTERLGNIYQWARETAKTYAPVLTVHQVKTEGEGVEYLTPSMLYLSGTVIQGEVDTLIMMGRNYNPGQDNNRFVYVAKNKGAYGPRVDVSMREARECIRIIPETASWEE